MQVIYCRRPQDPHFTQYPGRHSLLVGSTRGTDYNSVASNHDEFTVGLDIKLQSNARTRFGEFPKPGIESLLLYGQRGPCRCLGCVGVSDFITNPALQLWAVIYIHLNLKQKMTSHMATCKIHRPKAPGFLTSSTAEA